MSLWDDFWESFFGMFGAGAAGSAAGGVAGYSIGSLAGDAAAKAGASFGASLGAQMFSGWQKQDVPYGGLREGPPLSAEQQRQVIQMKAGLGDVALMTTGEVVPGSMTELDSKEQSAASWQGAVTPEQAKQWSVTPSPEQQEQAFYASFDPAAAREFKDALRNQMSEGYVADWAYTKTGTKEPPAQELRDGPLRFGEDTPQVRPPPPNAATPPSGPTLLERLQGLYGGEYTVSNVAPPTIDEVVSYGGESASPSAGSAYQGGPAGSSTRVLPSSAGVGPDAYVYLGSYGPYPAEVVLDPFGTAEGLVRGARDWVDPYLPERGTWQRGVVRGVAGFMWGTHPVGRVVEVFSSAYDVLNGWDEGTSKGVDGYMADVADWWASNNHPTYQLGKAVFGAAAAVESHDEELIAQVATQFTLIAVAMIAGGRGAKGRKPSATLSAARKLAASLRRSRTSPLPARACALTTKHGTFTAPSGLEERLHPVVVEIMERIPEYERSHGHMRCAEPHAATRALRAGDVEGGHCATVYVREAGEPLADAVSRPCKSCEALLRALKMTWEK